MLSQNRHCATIYKMPFARLKGGEPG